MVAACNPPLRVPTWALEKAARSGEEFSSLRMSVAPRPSFSFFTFLRLWLLDVSSGRVKACLMVIDTVRWFWVVGPEVLEEGLASGKLFI